MLLSVRSDEYGMEILLMFFEQQGLIWAGLLSEGADKARAVGH